MPGPADPSGLEARLREALPAARKARDPIAVGALRSALAAIDNAGAVALPTGAGPPAAEAPRDELTEDQVRAVVAAEIDERRSASSTYEAHGQTEPAATVRAEADLLARFLA